MARPLAPTCHVCTRSDGFSQGDLPLKEGPGHGLREQQVGCPGLCFQVAGALSAAPVPPASCAPAGLALLCAHHSRWSQAGCPALDKGEGGGHRSPGHSGGAQASHSGSVREEPTSVPAGTPAYWQSWGQHRSVHRTGGPWHSAGVVPLLPCRGAFSCSVPVGSWSRPLCRTGGQCPP